ncbi:MAG: ATP-binding protein [Verrucomicrobia bacterium]|nr:ATP-binding protein [Verrucomicrobiota bacterium]
MGDELIRDPGLAVFELVKNAYDADATRCEVFLESLEDATKAEIVVQDNGSGMSAETMRDVWLVIATDFRAQQRAERKRTKLGRFPLGNKGLGRLAVHKLGRHITVVTRVANRREVVVELDWEQLERVEDLSHTAITITSQDPEVFKGKAHGTRIEIRRLREAWDRGKTRTLHRAITSLCSPFHGPDAFKVKLQLKPQSDWLDHLLDPTEVRESALYYAKGEMEGSKLTYDYEFRPMPQMQGKLKPRGPERKEQQLTRKRAGERKVETVDLNSIPRGGEPSVSIGRIRFEFYIFDLETEVLKLAMTDVQGFKSYLKENGGIRIYRDGVRVFDFGEPGNDWLNLDGRRVNEPVGKVSNRQILGVVLLDGETSGALVEKSNREGFIENEAYAALQAALLCTLTHIEAERRKDQRQVRLFYSRRGAERPVMEEIADLRDALQQQGILEEMEPKLKTIERQFQTFQDTMLRAAAPGLSFGTVVHEAEKLVKELLTVVREDGDIRRVQLLVEQLAKLIDGLGDLFRRSGTAREKASVLIQQALFNCDFRFRAHRIKVVNGIELGNPDFKVECSRRLVVAALMNFIDNSIYWLQAASRSDRRIFIGTSRELDGGPCIVVADNGPGFQDEPEALVQPFFSRRPDGMGLGLYLADQAAQRHSVDGDKGQLRFPQRGDLTLPREFTGAIVAFQFPKEA